MNSRAGQESPTPDSVVTKYMSDICPLIMEGYLCKCNHNVLLVKLLCRFIKRARNFARPNEEGMRNNKAGRCWISGTPGPSIEDRSECEEICCNQLWMNKRRLPEWKSKVTRAVKSSSKPRVEYYGHKFQGAWTAWAKAKKVVQAMQRNTKLCYEKKLTRNARRFCAYMLPHMSEYEPCDWMTLIWLL